MTQVGHSPGWGRTFGGRLLVGLLLGGLLPCGLSGCLQTGQPLVAERSPVFTSPPTESASVSTRVYTVRKGDTLYSIAWRFELDYRGLAKANGIRAPYTIRPGQAIRLITQLPAGQSVRSSRADTRPIDARPVDVPGRVTKSTLAKTQSNPAPGVKTATSAQPTSWVWPLATQPSVVFGAKGAGGSKSKGMDFHLPGGRQASAKVRATAAGEVVYAGSGIGGFERLIIIKHSLDLLSAYGFDGQLLIKEHQVVKAGASIADIRDRGRVQPALHFELRRDGEPIDPRSVLR